MGAHIPDGARIDLRESPLDWRDYLNGEPIHNGDRFEWWDGTAWMLVRYETAGRTNAYIVVDDSGTTRTIDRETMWFRWPQRDLGPGFRY